MKKVELFHAWEWICDECGVSNFASSVTLTPDEAFERGIIDASDGPIEDGMMVFSEPEAVICVSCGTHYETMVDEDEEQ